MSGNKVSQQTKSRSKLYNLVSGAKEIAVAAGKLPTWTISFPNLAAVGNQVVIDGVVFEYCADGDEDAPGESLGTVADPHLITIGSAPNATTAADALVAAVVLEAKTTGKWGVLYPDNSVGASNVAGLVTLKFWPSTYYNTAGLITRSVTTGTLPTVTNTVTGVTAPSISLNHKYTFIDTSQSAAPKEYYHLPDGGKPGQEVVVMPILSSASDTPTIVGKLVDGGTANVEALFAAGQDGMSATFVWTGSAWVLVNEGNGTALAFTAAA